MPPIDILSVFLSLGRTVSSGMLKHEDDTIYGFTVMYETWDECTLSIMNICCIEK